MPKFVEISNFRMWLTIKGTDVSDQYITRSAFFGLRAYHTSGLMLFLITTDKFEPETFHSKQTLSKVFSEFYPIKMVFNLMQKSNVK